MFYVVAYDIPDDKRRTRLFKLMKGYGIHTQFSVFECSLDDNEFDAMIDKIKKVIDNEKDNIKIYFLCNSCLSKVNMFGNVELHKESDIIII